MTNRCNNHDCCGCGVCSSVCSFGAIVMKRDEHGFNVAYIDESKCNHCGICGLVCPTIKNVNNNRDIKKFALYTLNYDDAIKSQSGGAFYWVAKCCLTQGYIIYGVAVISPKCIRYIRCDNDIDLEKLRGSKYVQPSLELDTIRQIKKDLLNNQKVLLSGLPCHLQALLNYLDYYHVDTSNLLSIDIVCHGVPSMDVQETYIDYIEKKEKSSVTAINYRNKKQYGWATGYQQFTLENGKKIDGNIISILFNQCGYSLNHTCFDCKYTTPYRNTSLTIGDFWNCEKYLKVAVDYNRNGISFCVCRDQRIFDMLKKLDDSKYVLIESEDFKDYLPYQLIKPTNMPKQYNKFWKGFIKNKKRTILKYALPLKRRISRIVKKSPLKYY